MTDFYDSNRNQFILSKALIKDWLNTNQFNNPSKPGFFETVKRLSFKLFVEPFYNRISNVISS